MDAAELIDDLSKFISDRVLTEPNLYGAAAVALACVVSLALARGVSSALNNVKAVWLTPRARDALLDIVFPLSWLLLIGIGVIIAGLLGWRGGVLSVTLNLVTAWVVIRLISASITTSHWSRTFATVVWGYAALSITGIDEPLKELLASASVSLGQVSISVLSVIEGVVTLAALLWLSTVVMHFVERRVGATKDLTPSVQVLIGKLLRIMLVTAAFLITLGIVGVDLTALAVFGGAIGVGLGFGLQKIFANLISGIILLLDKSIKPGDVIAIGNYYGKVDSLGARYVSVYTRDGIEHLIPNEDLIANPVENWSYSQNLLRLKVSVGVHYKSDVYLARRLCLEAAAATPRVLEEPKAVCHLQGFGDSSVDLEIRFWINDPMNGRANVTSDLLLLVWDLFHQNDIEIPYPQRDLHLRSGSLALPDPHDT